MPRARGEGKSQSSLEGHFVARLLRSTTRVIRLAIMVHAQDAAVLAPAQAGELHGQPGGPVAEADLAKLLSARLANQSLRTVLGRGLGCRYVLAREVQSHAHQARALLQRVSSRPFQVEAHVDRSACLASALDLLGAE